VEKQTNRTEYNEEQNSRKTPEENKNAKYEETIVSTNTKL